MYLGSSERSSESSLSLSWLTSAVFTASTQAPIPWKAERTDGRCPTARVRRSTAPPEPVAVLWPQSPWPHLPTARSRSKFVEGCHRNRLHLSWISIDHHRDRAHQLQDRDHLPAAGTCKAPQVRPISSLGKGHGKYSSAGPHPRRTVAGGLDSARLVPTTLTTSKPWSGASPNRILQHLSDDRHHPHHRWSRDGEQTRLIA